MSRATAFYNEIDGYASRWMRNLIDAGHIMEGSVDERSIAELSPDDVAGFRRVHFFAGIAGWDRALQLAGWPPEREVWTGSCPCQPFSAAGKRSGFDDERHLWPAFFKLIDARRPAVVMGEQVASPDGLRWLDLVFSDLEAAGYTVRAADLCAAGVGAPHIRQRLWWRADRLADRHDAGLERRREPERECAAKRAVGPRGLAGGLADAAGFGCEPRARDGGVCGSDAGEGAAPGERGALRATGDTSPAHSFWRDADWLGCRDGKWRPVEPGTFPLADGVSARVGRLRAYGNAIVPQVAAAFIQMTEAAA